MHNRLKLTCGLSLAALLAACGGGSGGETPPPAPKLTPDQIRQYSAQSVFAGLELPVPTTLFGITALAYAQDPDATLECDSGTVTAEYIDVDGSHTVSVNDQVNFTFNQCVIEGEGDFSPTGEVIDFKLNGKLRAVITEFTTPEFARVAAAPARMLSRVSTSQKAQPTSAHLGVKLQYQALQVTEDYALDGTMRVRYSLSLPGSVQPQAAPADVSFVIAHSQESGEALKVSFSEAGKSYSQTFTEFRSEDSISCSPTAGCDDEDSATDQDDETQHRFTTLQFANKGSDPVLGSSFEYRMRVTEPLTPFSSGTMLTETSGETLTTVFSLVNNQPMVAVKSTGGAIWSGDLGTYAGD